MVTFAILRIYMLSLWWRKHNLLCWAQPYRYRYQI